TDETGVPYVQHRSQEDGSAKRANVQLSLFDHSVVEYAGASTPLYSSRAEKATGTMEQDEKKPRKTYRQEWHEYNLAQTHEKAKFQELLYELCRSLAEPPQETGRPRVL